MRFEDQAGHVLQRGAQGTSLAAVVVDNIVAAEFHTRLDDGSDDSGEGV